jgi:two-component system chemotaxis response regulator CheB
LSSPTRVLVVDDSLVCREILAAILDAEPDIQVIGQAENGKQALELNRKLRPDLVTMDIQMPGMDGFSTIEEIMAQNPVPILVVTSVPLRDGIDQSFLAIKTGALDLVKKPDPGSLEGRTLVEKVRVLSGVKVIRHRRARPALIVQPSCEVVSERIEVVALVSSTGGPKLLSELFGAMPREVSLAFLLTQHLPDGFVTGFIHWLNQEISLQVEQAHEGMRITPGMVLVAPSEKHLEVRQRGLVHLSDAPAIQSHRPSGTPMLKSVAKVYGKRAMGIILTGMGRDGAEGLLKLRQSGGLCIAQDEASSLIFGMPKAAIELGAATRVLGVNAIVQCILAHGQGRR